jgi:hypothetical protein
MSLLPLGLLSQGGGGGAAGAFELIESQVLAATATSVTFSSIPQTYKHLQVRFTSRFTDAFTSSNFSFRVNGDTGSNYASHRITNQSASISADNLSATSTPYLGFMPGGSTTANTFNSGIIDLLDYTSTVKTKTFKAFIGSESSSRMSIGGGLWNNTSAVTSLTFREPSGLTLAIGCRFSLYGIKG